MAVNNTLYYDHARYLDPVTGRFESMDPLQGSTTDVGNLNHFVYAAGNPVDLFDPSGMAWEWNAENGARAHLAFSVYALFQGKIPTFDFPLKSVADVLGYNLFQRNPAGGALKPDAVSFQDKTFFELKPVTHRDNPGFMAQDIAQLQSYWIGLKPHGFTAGDQTDIADRPMPIAAFAGADGQRYILMIGPADQSQPKLGGLLYYWTRKAPSNVRQRQTKIPFFALKPNLAAELQADQMVVYTKQQSTTVEMEIQLEDSIELLKPLAIASGVFYVGLAIAVLVSVAIGNSVMAKV
jgi:RHS repeat-associated protein